MPRLNRKELDVISEVIEALIELVRRGVNRELMLRAMLPGSVARLQVKFVVAQRDRFTVKVGGRVNDFVSHLADGSLEVLHRWPHAISNPDVFRTSDATAPHEPGTYARCC